MMNFDAEKDVTTDYWRAYFEWRATYGLSDDCMKELLEAIRVEMTNDAATDDQTKHLKSLEYLIQVEIEDDRQRRIA